MAALDGGSTSPFTNNADMAAVAAKLSESTQTNPTAKTKPAPTETEKVVATTKPEPAEIHLVSAQAVQSNGRHAVGVQTGGPGGRARIWGQGVQQGAPAQIAPTTPDRQPLDWNKNVAQDPDHLRALAITEQQALAQRNAAALAANGRKGYNDTTNGNALQAGENLAGQLDNTGLGPQSGLKGNIVAGAGAGAIMRGFVAPTLLKIATKLEHESDPTSTTYKYAHKYAVKFSQWNNLEKQLHEGLDPAEAAFKSKKNPGETAEAYAARLKQEADMIRTRGGVTPIKNDLVDKVTILRDKANYREGIDPTNIEEVRLNDLKVQFLNRYLKAAPGEHGKLLESFVEKNSINGRAALTEADSKLLQDMAVAVDKDAQLTSKLTKAAETMPTAILRGLRGGAFVALVDEANYYTDVFAHHDSSKPAHPAITLAMGYVAPLAFFSGGIIKSAPEGAGFWARTANTFKRGGAAVGFSLAGAVGLTLLDHAVPFMRHSQFSNIMDPTTGESVVEGAAWVMPVAEEKTRWKMAGYTWLMGRATNLSNKEAAVAAVGVPLLTGALYKAKGLEGGGKMMLTELAFIAAGRGLNWLGLSGNDRTGVNDDAWKAVKKDTEKMTSSSLHDAVDAMTDLGKKSDEALMVYRAQTIDARDKNNKIVFPIAPEDNTDPSKVDFGKIISNDRTALILAEAEGKMFLNQGLTQTQMKRMYGKYTPHGIGDGFMGMKPEIAPGMEADLTGQALRDTLFASTMCEITERNLKLAQSQQQAGHDTPGFKKVTQDDIDQMEAEKKKLNDTMKSMLRDGPDAKPHDIEGIVDGSYGVFHQNSYSLAQFATHDQETYPHLIDALQNKIADAQATWLPNQRALGLNADLAQKYVAKLCRDAAMMRLGEAIYQNDHKANGEAKVTMAGNFGPPTNDPNSWKNVNSMIAMARAYDPDNVDLKALEAYKVKVAQKIKNGDDDWYNKIKNPFHIDKPPFAQ
jgi:hypothetical protein